VFSQIWGILLHVDKSTSVDKWIVWELLCITEFDALVSVEGTRKLIAVYNSKDTTVKLYVDSNIQILPGV